MHTPLNIDRLYISDLIAGFHFLVFVFLVAVHTRDNWSRTWCRAINSKTNRTRFKFCYVAIWGTMSILLPVTLHKCIVFICVQTDIIKNDELLTNIHFIISTYAGFVICLLGMLNCWYITYARDGKGEVLRLKLS